MAEIDLVHVTKRFPDGTTAVDDVTFKIDDGEFFILVGPSGCGKSTLLNMIVGLEDISDGELRVDGKVVNDVDPKDRNMAMVFQSYALYPHMTVRENMGFPLKLAKMPEDDIKKRVDEAAKILQLSELLDRKPSNLSGGQRQRVAMGRAIVREPAAFLMDEPLSNLDAKLRVQTRTQIARLQDRLETTTVYVTHDQTEAMTLGDRIALMRRGVVQQLGTPRELYEEPVNLFVAGFIGSPAMNFLRGEIDGSRIKLPMVETDLPSNVVGKNKGTVIAGIRPENFEDAALGARGGRWPRGQVRGHHRGHRVDGLGALRLLQRRRCRRLRARSPRRPLGRGGTGRRPGADHRRRPAQCRQQGRAGSGSRALARRPRRAPVRPGLGPEHLPRRRRGRRNPRGRSGGHGGDPIRAHRRPRPGGAALTLGVRASRAR